MSAPCLASRSFRRVFAIRPPLLLQLRGKGCARHISNTGDTVRTVVAAVLEAAGHSAPSLNRLLRPIRTTHRSDQACLLSSGGPPEFAGHGDGAFAMSVSSARHRASARSPCRRDCASVPIPLLYRGDALAARKPWLYARDASAAAARWACALCRTHPSRRAGLRLCGCVVLAFEPARRHRTYHLAVARHLLGAHGRAGRFGAFSCSATICEASGFGAPEGAAQRFFAGADAPLLLSSH